MQLSRLIVRDFIRRRVWLHAKRTIFHIITNRTPKGGGAERINKKNQ